MIYHLTLYIWILIISFKKTYIWYGLHWIFTLQQQGKDWICVVEKVTPFCLCMFDISMHRFPLSNDQLPYTQRHEQISQCWASGWQVKEESLRLLLAPFCWADDSFAWPDNFFFLGWPRAVRCVRMFLALGSLSHGSLVKEATWLLLWLRGPHAKMVTEKLPVQVWE